MAIVMLILFLENLIAVGEMSLQVSPEQTKEDIRDQTLFITGGVGGGGSLDFWENKRGDQS